MAELPKQANKLVLIIDSSLELGLIANTAAVLALSVGARHPELIGEDIQDGGGEVHIGITSIAIPVLASEEALLTTLVQKVAGTQVELVSFSKIAQSIHSYEEYSQVLGQTSGSNIRYSGIAIYGPKKMIDSLTGSLPRLK